MTIGAEPDVKSTSGTYGIDASEVMPRLTTSSAEIVELINTREM
ncbi:hypothetical protein [Sorangium cellulosum]|nr:hypothetical protein [Sorangium cellulosum]